VECHLAGSVCLRGRVGGDDALNDVLGAELPCHLEGVVEPGGVPRRLLRLSLGDQGVVGIADYDHVLAALLQLVPEEDGEHGRHGRGRGWDAGSEAIQQDDAALGCRDGQRRKQEDE
jgi:hypothetical protein